MLFAEKGLRAWGTGGLDYRNQDADNYFSHNMRRGRTSPRYGNKPECIIFSIAIPIGLLLNDPIIPAQIRVN